MPRVSPYGTTRPLLQSPLPDSNRRPPPYHGTSEAIGRNRRQAFRLVFAAGCERLQPRGSIKAPSFVVSLGDRSDRAVRSRRDAADAATQGSQRILSPVLAAS